ncbi:hypothetical protein [Hymenobacter jeollabukensis]|uniref:Uncharacterized protein n=1 Tax=Hymenobacter jeollabukensis TaxID=2025313 RepID=A0A5R8WIT3_9BACT|nr:hypothetical protein [Hymenobacter jeollabukensis]TLM88496.1 hypothetical protein FDY95_24350 [Hymenobacter jeollabukensis]
MKIPFPLQEGLFWAYPASISTRGENANNVPNIAKIIRLLLLKRQLKKALLRLICISNEQITSHLVMFYDAFELAPGEVPADRYDPADEQPQQSPSAAADELTEWDTNPWF